MVTIFTNLILFLNISDCVWLMLNKTIFWYNEEQFIKDSSKKFGIDCFSYMLINGNFIRELSLKNSALIHGQV